MFWIAFACAAAIHLGAVVLAKSKFEKTTIQDFGPPEVEIKVFNAQPEHVQREDSVMLPQFSPDEETFLEENRTPRSLRPSTKPRVVSFTRVTSAPFGSIKAPVMYAPRPVYPYEARRHRIIGSGIALLIVDPTDGGVTAVQIAQSCGNAILDSATIEAFRRWRFKPGTARTVQVPITYTLTGASY
jgi:TonB family protein